MSDNGEAKPCLCVGCGGHLFKRVSLVMLLVGMTATPAQAGAPADAPSPSTSPTSRPGGRWAVPDSALQDAAQKLIHELFHADFAQRAPAGRKALAGKLMEQAAATLHDPAARYVLLDDARELAGQCGDPVLAMKAIAELDRYFDIEALPLRLSALAAINHATASPGVRVMVATEALGCVDVAIAGGQLEDASRFVALADRAADKSQSVPLALKVRTAMKELAALRQEEARCRAAELKLHNDPDDAASHTVVGRHLCFMRGDWSEGLAHLAAGDDDVLRSIAARELAMKDAGDSVERMAIANLWWDYSQSQGRFAAARVQRHAGGWYRRAMPGLSGINLAVARQRMGKIEADPALLSQLAPGLAAAIYAGQQFQHLLLRRIDPRINNDWGKDAPGEGLPKDDFSIRWRGFIKIDKAGHYTFAVIANMGARLIIDGQTLIESENLARSRKGASADIELTEGAHAIQAEVWDGGGVAKMIVLWTSPGADKPVPIPAEAFGHAPASDAE